MKFRYVTLLWFGLSTLVARAQTSGAFHNPILSGTHPDPSVCRVDSTYYLATSTFEYSPGIPIFQSKDLVHWKLISHVFTRPGQLDLTGMASSDGVYAPVIRYYRGTFYVVTSLVVRNPRKIKNVLLTAPSPRGPWSDPIALTDDLVWGIDPSLFFDDDGKCYFTANRKPLDGEKHPGHRQICLQELDLKTQQLVGEVIVLSEGSLVNARNPEGPHIYKKDGAYYLLFAEGGTEMGHSICISKSSNVRGPYENYAYNPLLTHRNLGNTVEIQNVGHGEIVETQQGEWWMVCLGSRIRQGFSILGRETFLVPLTWEKEAFPVVSPGVGRVQSVERRPALPADQPAVIPASEQFENDSLPLIWNFLRTPRKPFWSLNERPGYLTMTLLPEEISQPVSPAFVGRRILHHSFTAIAKFEFTPKTPNEAAGTVLLNDQQNNYQFVKTLEKGRAIVKVMERKQGQETVLAHQEIAPGKLVYLKIVAHDQTFSFYYSTTPDQWKLLLGNTPGQVMGFREFTGAYVGLYATSAGHKSSSKMAVDWFEYQAL